MTCPSQQELRQAYSGKRVLITGHTGFKGSWLLLWLRELGAKISGYALAPDTEPSFFRAAALHELCDRHLEADIRHQEQLEHALREAQPHYVFHLAAQALVRRSYQQPIETLQTNVMGTAHLLEAVRQLKHPCAVVVVTSDKCYENREWEFGYRENDAMGGHDIYSMSKGAAELVVSSYRRSFFEPSRLAEHQVALASARAGNVIGGGDWAQDRIVPDGVRALAQGRPIPVRNPQAVRPWQHVLEPLGGYLLLGARLASVGTTHPSQFCGAWNFGPHVESAQPVRAVVEQLIEAWGQGSWDNQQAPGAVHEAGLLRLSIEKANAKLNWSPRWSFNDTLRRTAEWYRAFYNGVDAARLRALSVKQIKAYGEA